MNNPALEDDTVKHRYELIDDGRLIGFIEYYLFGNVFMIMHTEVDAALEGQGFGTKLARQVLDHVRSEGKCVVPICGFIAQHIRKYREHLDLVTPECRRIFNV